MAQVVTAQVVMAQVVMAQVVIPQVVMGQVGYGHCPSTYGPSSYCPSSYGPMSVGTSLRNTRPYVCAWTQALACTHAIMHVCMHYAYMLSCMHASACACALAVYTRIYTVPAPVRLGVGIDMPQRVAISLRWVVEVRSYLRDTATSLSPHACMRACVRVCVRACACVRVRGAAYFDKPVIPRRLIIR